LQGIVAASAVTLLTGFEVVLFKIVSSIVPSAIILLLQFVAGFTDEEFATCVLLFSVKIVVSVLPIVTVLVKGGSVVVKVVEWKLE